MIGTVLRVRYEITQSIGEAALFSMYSARDRLHGREVCVRLLKEPFNNEREFVDKLSTVVQQVAQIQHPNLEKMYGVDGEEDAPFIVSEFAKGSSLSERLRKLGSLSVPVSVGTAVVICEALQALHSAKIAHGDIGSHNIVISSEGEAKLQLPGIWQAYSFSSNAGEAVLPQMAPYLAPEISRGSMPSAKSDVYSIGVLLYEMLAGRSPFHADSAAALALKHVNDPSPNVRMMNPSVPIVLSEIVKKAMSKEPEARYENAADILSDLRILQDALKFGRTLTWPIRTEHSPVQDVQPVAPKMSAVREEIAEKESSANPKRKVKVKDPRVIADASDGDVPLWLKMLIWLFTGIVGVLIIGWVVFNMNKPKAIRIPDTRRLTFSEAMSRLNDLGLKVRISNKTTSTSIPAEHVVTSSPAPGETTKEGSTVGLTISIGSDVVQVPKLVGEDVDQAKQMLASVDLQASDYIEEVPSEKRAGIVLGQEPAPGTKTVRTSSVKLKVSSGHPPEKANNPKTKYLYNIGFPLTGVTEWVNVKIVMVDARGSKVIYEHRHEPDDEIQFTAEGFGDRVKLIVYYDNNQVLEQSVVADDTADDQSQ